MVEEVIWTAGLLLCVWALYRVAILAYALFVYDGNKTLASWAGSWAVVTGSSYGIGKAYAESLAKRRFNVVLIARSADKLESLARQLEAQFGVQTKVIAADFKSFQDDERKGSATNVYTKIAEELDPLNVTLLVNNVGGGGSELGRYLEGSWEDEETIRYINTVPTQQLTRLLLPKMLKKGKGAILNISSLAYQYGVYVAAYGAQKAAINALTLLLKREYGQSGVIFQSVLVGHVSTEATGNPEVNFMTCRSETIAENTLRYFGWDTFIVPYMPHGLGPVILGLLPFWLQNILIEQNAAKVRDFINNAHKKKTS